MQRSVRRRRQLLVFRLCRSNKFSVHTKQCTLQMMQCLRFFSLPKVSVWFGFYFFGSSVAINLVVAKAKQSAKCPWRKLRDSVH